jgi:hypothetical protein
MDAGDVLISNGKTAKRLGVTTRSIFRWTSVPELNFPQPCFINGRRYFSQFEIDMWRDRRFGVLPDAGIARGKFVSPGKREARDPA